MKKLIYIAKPDYNDYKMMAAFDNRHDAELFAKHFLSFDDDNFDPQRHVVAIPVIQFAQSDVETTTLYQCGKPVMEVPTNAESDEDRS